jgi:hypothetical protein
MTWKLTDGILTPPPSRERGWPLKSWCEKVGSHHDGKSEQIEERQRYERHVCCERVAHNGVGEEGREGDHDGAPRKDDAIYYAPQRRAADAFQLPLA